MEYKAGEGDKVALPATIWGNRPLTKAWSTSRSTRAARARAPTSPPWGAAGGQPCEAVRRRSRPLRRGAFVSPRYAKPIRFPKTVARPPTPLKERARTAFVKVRR